MSASRPLAGSGAMLFSAALFGYFGFLTAFPEIDPTTGSRIALVVTLKWTLRAAAIGFAAGALLAFAAPWFGNLVYAVVGIASAVAFLAIAAWDLQSSYTSGIHPILLLAFAGWNGVGSWTGLRSLFGGIGDRGAPDPRL